MVRAQVRAQVRAVNHATYCLNYSPVHSFAAEVLQYEVVHNCSWAGGQSRLTASPAAETVQSWSERRARQV